MSNSKWKRPNSVDKNLLYKQSKPRNRTRSTVFEDEVGKAERRTNRRQNDKQLIDEELQLEEEAMFSEVEDWNYLDPEWYEDSYYVDYDDDSCYDEYETR